MYSQALQQDCKQNTTHKTDCSSELGYHKPSFQRGKNFLEKFSIYQYVRGLVWRDVILLNNCYFYSSCDISSNWWYRELKQTTTATAAKTPENKRINEQNNG